VIVGDLIIIELDNTVLFEIYKEPYIDKVLSKDEICIFIRSNDRFVDVISRLGLGSIYSSRCKLYEAG
jgi:hypothetical protein